MEVDAVSYAIQCRRISQGAREDKTLKKYAHGVPRGTKIVPVVTLVFYTGSRPWDGPKSLYDMCQLLVRDGRLDELHEAANNRTKLLELLKEYSLLEDDIQY